MSFKQMLTFFSCLLMGASLYARELTFKEKVALSTLERTLNVKTYMQDHIDEGDLSWSQWAEYRLLMKSCRPVVSHRDKILSTPEEDELGDQSEKLYLLYNGCQEGVLSLTRLYTELNP